MGPGHFQWHQTPVSKQIISRPADTSMVSHSGVQSQPVGFVAGCLGRRQQITEVWGLRGIAVSLVSSRAVGDICQRCRCTKRIQQPPGFKDGIVWLEFGCFS